MGYQAGNVTLQPERLGGHQKFIKEKLGSKLEKPTYLVMHGGSGSSQDEIRLAVKNGVIKMNIDTDTQWAYWQGLRDHYEGQTKGKDAICIQQKNGTRVKLVTLMDQKLQ